VKEKSHSDQQFSDRALAVSIRIAQKVAAGAPNGNGASAMTDDSRFTTTTVLIVFAVHQASWVTLMQICHANARTDLNRILIQLIPAMIQPALTIVQTDKSLIRILEVASAKKAFTILKPLQHSCNAAQRVQFGNQLSR